MPSNDKTAEILARLPGPMAFSPSRKKWFLVLLISVAFVAISIWMIKTGDEDYVYGWIGLVFFGLGAMVAIIAMLPGAGGLKLDREGFEITSLYRSNRVRWQDASGFDTARISSQLMVVFDDVNAKKKALSSVNVAIAGRNSALPETYGFDAKDLADLMAHWRARAVQRP